MAELWTKKKKILSRKERFKITDDGKKKDAGEISETLIPRTEDEILKLRAEQNAIYERIALQHRIRCEQLDRNCDTLRRYACRMADVQNDARNANTRRKHPDIVNLNRIVPWINERISRWSREKSPSNRVADDIRECFYILNTIIDYVENPSSLRYPHHWYECKRHLRDELHHKLDHVTYAIVKNIEKRMTMLDADVMFRKESNHCYTNLLWTVLDKPRTGKDDKYPLSANFADLGVLVNLPKSFHRKPIVIRCLWTEEDYFSEDCRTWPEKDTPEEYRDDLLQYHIRLWRQLEIERVQQQRQIDAQLEKEKQRNIFNKIKYLIPSSSKENLLDDTKPTPDTPSHQTSPANPLDRDRREIDRLKTYYTVEPHRYECNMRKYNVVGGVYHLELLKQPPQPRLLKDGAVLRTIVGPDRLQRYEYTESYEPPIVKPGVAKQSTDDEDEDAENTPEGKLLSKLVLVTMKLPDHVLWFDAPIPVRWDNERRYWSIEYIYEVKFNEEKQTLSFRAGKITPFALAVFKYNNFPYQSWELKPYQDGVTFSLTTSALVLEFVVRSDRVSLVLLENANTSALQQHVGVFYSPAELVRILRRGGVNVFPAQDACLYVDGIPKKHHVVEDHLYHCMACLCSRWQFGWSRWNLTAGYRKFVARLRRPCDHAKDTLLVVTDERAFVADGLDTTQAFDETDYDETQFYPDLLTLARQYDQQNAIETDPIFVETVYYLLSRTRVMSFS